MIDMAVIDDNRLEENKKRFAEVFTCRQGSIVTSKWSEPGCGITQKEQYLNKDKDFEAQVSQANMQIAAMNEGFDNVPVVAFFGAIAYLMTLAYGCKQEFQGDLLISRYQYDAFSLAKDLFSIPQIYERGLYGIALARIEEFQNRYPQMPVSVSDTQSPIDILTEFMSAEQAVFMCVDDPGLAHRILEVITQSLIEVNHQYRKVIRNFAGFKSSAYLPMGIHVSDDNAAYLSPGIYREFALPYAEKLSREFGGISFHVCMKFEQNLKIIASTKGFIGFDAMPYYNDPEKVLDALGGGKVWEIYDYSFSRPDHINEKPFDFYKRIIDMNEGRNALRIDTFAQDRNDALTLAYAVKNYTEKRH